MSIYTQKHNGLESIRITVKQGSYCFQAGLSIKKHGRINAEKYAKELKAIALDSRIPLPTRRRLFDERRRQMG
jgi:hypothetical protein